ncbi:hypothetical protein QQ045_021627 [Rhodiola kirilowii]
MKTIAMFVFIASAAAALWWPHAEAADPDCSGAIPQLTDCLDFVTNGSKIENPKPSCCKGIKDVLDVSPICLCVGLKSSVQLGVTLNITKALSLPSLCHISAPNSTCGLIPAPGPTPPESLYLCGSYSRISAFNSCTTNSMQWTKCFRRRGVSSSFAPAIAP